MAGYLKTGVLHASKGLGLFHLARRLTRDGLRILCYHAFAFEDESSFRARMFLRPETFQKRLEFLKKHGVPVLPLEQALDLLDQDRLPPGATVITIDDGFFSVYRFAFRALQKFSFPATLYVASYYCERGNPVYRLCVQYMFWKTKVAEIDLDGLGLDRRGKISLRDPVEKDKLTWELIRHGETRCEEPQRRTLGALLGKRLRVDYEHIAQSRMLGMMTSEETRELASAGVDIQLHTHRHRFPEEQSLAMQELADNRKVLEPLAGRPLHHFCYPSGVFAEAQFPWLRAAGIRSATTCEPGLNNASTDKLALRRFLDGEDILQIEFEAELSGFTELLRQVRERVRSAFRAGKKRPRALSYS
jgi:peptidoglycan/xylan/chitin deacetylase (PgdA/CDA1 family)